MRENQPLDPDLEPVTLKELPKNVFISPFVNDMELESEARDALQ